MHIDLSSVPGTRSRPYRGTSDHAAMAALLNRWFRAAGIDQVSTVEELDHNYAHLENCDPLVDMVLVESDDGLLIGYTRTDWWQVEGGERKYAVFAKVDPEWVGTGLPKALLEADQEHSRQIAATHVVDAPKVFEGWAEDHAEQALADAYLALGFRPVTYEAVMVRPNLDHIPEHSLPDGVEMRSVEETHLRAIWEADREAFRDHWGSAEVTEEDWLRFLEFPHRDESLWRVAWDGDEVVGQVRAFINLAENTEFGRLRGWTEFISTRRDWRRHGVARALICASLHGLRERGMTEAALGVHTENPNGAFALYESLGFEVERRSTTYQQPLG
jgi:mycothiol synthase